MTSPELDRKSAAEGVRERGTQAGQNRAGGQLPSTSGTRVAPQRKGRVPVPHTGVIAIDGPSGTGKSSVARTLARRLGMRYLDTGAMYRAVTWAVLEDGIELDDADAVAACGAALDLEIDTDPDDDCVRADGIQVDKVIRSAPVTAAVSAVSAVPEVR